jgi:hypothetical protein
MAVDLGVFERQKSIIDQQQLQDAFDLKKALAIQGAQQNALQMRALESQINNGGISAKDLLQLQFQQQNAQENRDLRREGMLSNEALRREQMRQSADLARANLDMRGQDREDKRNKVFINDQNALAGILLDTDNQLKKIDEMFDAKGNLKKDYADVYGAVAGYEMPTVFQSTVDARANLDNIINNSVFQKLGELKAQSATGASGLGSLSNQEGALLRSSATAAGDYKQSRESAAKNLKAYRAQIEASRNNLIKGFQSKYGKRDSLPSFPDAPQPVGQIDPAAAKAELDRRRAAKQTGGQ